MRAETTFEGGGEVAEDETVDGPDGVNVRVRRPPEAAASRGRHGGVTDPARVDVVPS